MSDKPKIRWGILGPGGIARQFAAALGELEGALPWAVGSRSQERAETFARVYGFRRAYGSYEALAADPEIDIIYVATPHTLHREHALLCLEAGKAVLCEKPLAVNAQQVEEMIAVARRRDLFLMEALWTRCLPVMARVRRWLAEGRIGNPRLMRADFGFRTPWKPEERLLNPALAGGALLDVGVYVVALATMVLGNEPERIQATGHLGRTGVDEQSALLLTYAGGAIADLFCAVRTETRQAATLYGSEGRIEVPNFWHAEEASLYRDEELMEEAHASAGYGHEAAEAMACLAQGRTESEIISWEDSLAVARILDAARDRIGLRYPFEER